MRFSPTLFALALCAASFTTAQAQNATPAPPHTRTNQAPVGMTFNYDAEHGMINATGMQTKAAPMASTSAPSYTGTVNVTINIKIASNFRPGTLYHCSALFVGGELDTDSGLVAGGLETANGFARRTGAGTATCTFTIPFAWSLPSAPSADTGLVIAFGARAVDFSGKEKEVSRSTFQVDGIENLPSDASTSSFVFDVTL
jgi:type V secretory pathway adhesin AidA